MLKIDSYTYPSKAIDVPTPSFVLYGRKQKNIECYPSLSISLQTEKYCRHRQLPLSTFSIDRVSEICDVQTAAVYEGGRPGSIFCSFVFSHNNSDQFSASKLRNRVKAKPQFSQATRTQLFKITLTFKMFDMHKSIVWFALCSICASLNCQTFLEYIQLLSDYLRYYYIIMINV